MGSQGRESGHGSAEDGGPRKRSLQSTIKPAELNASIEAGRSTDMNTIELTEGILNIEAPLIAGDLGLDPARVLEAMRSGRLTAVCERGVHEDAGRYRLTFFHSNRRLRLIVSEDGRILERSAARLHRRGSRAGAVAALAPEGSDGTPKGGAGGP